MSISEPKIVFQRTLAARLVTWKHHYGRRNIKCRSGELALHTLLAFAIQWFYFWQSWYLFLHFTTTTFLLTAAFPISFFLLYLFWRQNFLLLELKCHDHMFWFHHHIALCPVLVRSIFLELLFIAVTTGVYDSSQFGSFVKLMNMQLSPLSQLLRQLAKTKPNNESEHYVAINPSEETIIWQRNLMEK